VSKSGVQTRVLGPAQFFAALTRPDVTIRSQAHGHHTAPGNWCIHPRVIGEHLLYLVEDHAMEGRVAGKPVRLEPGCFIWIQPGVSHEMSIAKGKPPFRFFHLKPEIRSRRPERCLRLKQDFFLLRNAASLQLCWSELLDELNSQQLYAAERQRFLLGLLMSRALRMQQVLSTSGPVFDSRQRTQLSAYVQQHLGKRFSPTTLAGLLDLNEDYFGRVFRRTFGVPPRVWIMRERQREAARRLETGNQTISEVAYALGYRDVYLFSRQFKQVFGRSPRAFRQAL
jgi:AraC-like DNA-binding protein